MRRVIWFWGHGWVRFWSLVTQQAWQSTRWTVWGNRSWRCWIFWPGSCRRLLDFWAWSDPISTAPAKTGTAISQPLLFQNQPAELYEPGLERQKRWEFSRWSRRSRLNSCADQYRILLSSIHKGQVELSLAILSGLVWIMGALLFRGCRDTDPVWDRCLCFLCWARVCDALLWDVLHVWHGGTMGYYTRCDWASSDNLGTRRRLSRPTCMNFWRRGMLPWYFLVAVCRRRRSRRIRRWVFLRWVYGRSS